MRRTPLKRARMAVSIIEGETVTELGASELRRGRDEWSGVEYDLSRFAGRRIVLRLEATSEAILSTGKWAWWGSPRVAQRTSGREATPPVPSPPPPST